MEPPRAGDPESRRAQFQSAARAHAAARDRDARGLIRDSEVASGRAIAPGLRATGTAPHVEGFLVEALESEDGDDWLVGVQCHPERSELIGPEFKRLWRAFVDAAARSGRRRRS